MLLLGVLGLAFAGGDTKAKKSVTVVQKKVRRTRQTIKRKKKQRSNNSSQSSPPSHGNHMYIPSQSQTRDYTSPVNRGQYNREVPSRTPSASSSTSQRRTRATTSHRYSDSTTWSGTPRTSSTTRQKRTGAATSTTVRQNIPTSSSTRRDRQTTTTRRDRSQTAASTTVRQNIPTTSSTRRTQDRTATTTNQDRSTPVSTSTTRRDRKRRTSTYPKHTPNIQQNETSSTQTRRSRSYQYDNDYRRNHASRTRTRTARTENSYTRQRQQESQSNSCYSSTTRAGLRGSQHALEMNSDVKNSGMGWAVGFQPCDGIFELEMSHVSFGDGFAIGVDSPVQLTAQLYGSNSGLAPFVSFGVHGAQNDLVKELGFMDDEVLIGTHGGLGLRYKAGPLSVTLEGRYGSYIDQEFSQLQGLAGVNVHF